MARGAVVKSTGTGAKKKKVSFVIDCSKPAEDTIMEMATFEKFLQERIKVGGKPGALGNSVSITRDVGKITVTADSNFSKWYLKYLTKKFLKKHDLRDWLRVVAPNKDKNVYEVRYFRIDDEVASDQED
ncbi:Large ribosomal subunit protein eL22x [Cardamine amara subsp. amara]|uniref:Large ribosomal subunit protein eL22x n=1 Tax=Cardamine amara subsp. amara TaxID=228776 RepID=A0ABD1BFU4_CARAN